jgi:tRNA/tmRNA/rRNA uracil-C5-methylase (TrmA/RlmC/RlmD family)
MKSILKKTKDKVITDLTGNVGGDTILFGLNFKNVHSIEFNDENFKALENNINVFKT